MRTKVKNILNILPMLNLVMILLVLVLVLPDLAKFAEIEVSSSIKDRSGSTIIIRVDLQQISIFSGNPSILLKKIKRVTEHWDMAELHKALGEIAKTDEKQSRIEINPTDDVTYQDIIHIIDTAKDQHFSDVVLGNLG